jgi:hypothetical protein
VANLGSFEFGEFEQFRDNLKALARAWPGFMKDCVVVLANNLLAKIVPLTPSNQGELRRGWTIGEVTLTSTGAEIEVFNHVEYSFYIENGFASHWVPGKWEGNTFYYIPNYEPEEGEPGGMQVGPKDGWVEGKFMLQTSTDTLERELPDIMERKMKRLLERYLG